MYSFWVLEALLETLVREARGGCDSRSAKRSTAAESKISVLALIYTQVVFACWVVPGGRRTFVCLDTFLHPEVQPSCQLPKAAAQARIPARPGIPGPNIIQSVLRLDGDKSGLCARDRSFGGNCSPTEKLDLAAATFKPVAGHLQLTS